MFSSRYVFSVFSGAMLVGVSTSVLACAYSGEHVNNDLTIGASEVRRSKLRGSKGTKTAIETPLTGTALAVVSYLLLRMGISPALGYFSDLKFSENTNRLDKNREEAGILRLTSDDVNNTYVQQVEIAGHGDFSIKGNDEVSFNGKIVKEGFDEGQSAKMGGKDEGKNDDNVENEVAEMSGESKDSETSIIENSTEDAVDNVKIEGEATKQMEDDVRIEVDDKGRVNGVNKETEEAVKGVDITGSMDEQKPNLDENSEAINVNSVVGNGNYGNENRELEMSSRNDDKINVGEEVIEAEENEERHEQQDVDTDVENKADSIENELSEKKGNVEIKDNVKNEVYDNEGVEDEFDFEEEEINIEENGDIVTEAINGKNNLLKFTDGKGFVRYNSEIKGLSKEENDYLSLLRGASRDIISIVDKVKKFQEGYAVYLKNFDKYRIFCLKYNELKEKYDNLKTKCRSAESRLGNVKGRELANSKGWIKERNDIESRLKKFSKEKLRGFSDFLYSCNFLKTCKRRNKSDDVVTTYENYNNIYTNVNDLEKKVKAIRSLRRENITDEVVKNKRYILPVNINELNIIIGDLEDFKDKIDLRKRYGLLEQVDFPSLKNLKS